ncbi:MAG: gliding motility-associated C-terminal domain-containing protein [Siphonobacter sp.]
MKKLYCLLCFLVLFPLFSQANHIVGGNLEMVATSSTPGSYTLALILYFDNISGVNTKKDASIVVSIFRKSDNNRMVNITIPLVSTTAVDYANPTCAEARSLSTSALRYEKAISLTPADYTDTGGYYIAWERCCRNNGIDNITDPGQTGMTFYLEFPALLQNNQSFLNSSPVFNIVNGEYICINKAFSSNFGATDADGDELRYSIVTPYMGYSSTSNPTPTLPTASSSYPLVNWASGFSTTNEIPGNPPLTVDASTGVISVTANQLGLFVFTVLVEEYRNGTQIGAVRRDFQLLVVDCPESTLEDPVVYKDDTPETERDEGITTATFCEGGYLDLITQDQDGATYQWQKDGANISGATSNVYRAESAGVYTVIISSSTVCSESKESEQVTLISVPGIDAEITSNISLPACSDQQVILSTLQGTNYSYLWMVDSDTLTATTYSTVAEKSGTYSVKIEDKTTSCYYIPTKDVVINPMPRAEYTSVPTARSFCGQDSVALVAFDSANYVFQWYLDGQAISGATKNSYTIKASGVYSFQVNIGSCLAVSDTFAVALYPNPTVSFDSIAAVCSSSLDKITLVGTPAGGVFSGKGVSGTTFDPAIAGVGQTPITYTVTNEYGCSVSAVRYATVERTPTLTLGYDQIIIEGDSVQIPGTSDANLTYSWSPTTALSSSSVLNPFASPTETTVYTLTATSSVNGCSVSDSIRIIVWPKITIPNGFTPNGDGKNDTWQLPGLEKYPNAEVRIYNRWGTELFYSNSYSGTFDGTYKGKKLPVATYYYLIYPNNGRPAISGSVTIVY